MFPSQWNFQWLSLCWCSLEMLKSCMNALFGRVLVRLADHLFTRTLVKILRWRSGWQKGHSGWHAYITTPMDRKGVERWPAGAGCIPRDDLLSIGVVKRHKLSQNHNYLMFTRCVKDEITRQRLAVESDLTYAFADSVRILDSDFVNG